MRRPHWLSYAAHVIVTGDLLTSPLHLSKRKSPLTTWSIGGRYIFLGWCGSDMLITLSSIVLAVLLGFASHRASICTVRAVAEVVSTGRGHILMSIAKSILWVLAITIPFMWLMPQAQGDQTEWALSALTLVGGGIYGTGAAINGGCAFSTLNQLADGKLRMLGALLGF